MTHPDLDSQRVGPWIPGKAPSPGACVSQSDRTGLHHIELPLPVSVCRPRLVTEPHPSAPAHKVLSMSLTLDASRAALHIRRSNHVSSPRLIPHCEPPAGPKKGARKTWDVSHVRPVCPKIEARATADESGDLRN